MNTNLLSLTRKFFLSRRPHCIKRCSHTSSVLNRVLNLKEGQKIHGYVVEKVCEVPELHLAAVQLNHVNTGAAHLHVARDDSDNLFSVAFTTIPKDNTGIPHILEHLVLCGSQKFPCRDPFFKMLNRSLSTFMNAFTGSDYTMYPFSTQNPKDFKNLLQVYLDAVFFPNLKENDFRQEGWRLEHEDVDNQKSPIILKGVVYNEMKGAFSESNHLFAQAVQNKLFPSNTYSYVSGGDPQYIPELTWDQLKQFHHTFYHPSNARFFTYGNIPLESHLESLEELALSKFSKLHINSEVSDEVNWLQPKVAKIHCQPDPMAPDPDKQTVVSISYLLNRITDTYETFALSILSNLLTDGPNSPFYQALIESGMGSDYSPATGIDCYTKQSYFSIGLQGISKEDINKVTDTIERTVDKVISEGFPQQRIEGILHNIELATKHQESKYGLMLTMAINSAWNHGGNPIHSLEVNKHVEWFRQKLAEDPSFLQNKLKQYFKGNIHKLTLIMDPKEDYEKEKLLAEEKLVEEKLKNLSKLEKENIYNNGLELQQKQREIEYISCLPTLHITDVEKTITATPIQVITSDNIPIYLCEQPTNGIIYFRAFTNFAHIPDHLKKFLPLFCKVVTNMGAGDKDYKQFDQEVELRTGGLQAKVHIAEDPKSMDKFEQGVLFSSHCLDYNVHHMFNLWADIFNRIRFNDEERLCHLVRIYAAELAHSLADDGHVYTLKQASSCLSANALLKEQMEGMSQVIHMKKLAEMTQFAEVLQKLKEIANFLLNKNNLRCSVNVAPSAAHSAVKHLQSLLSSISTSIENMDNNLPEITTPVRRQAHFVMPFAVNYVGKCILSVPYCHDDYASLSVAAKLLTSKFLHREIRERGGAYGGGCSLSTGGMFNFYSYRDPNLTQTLNAFNDAIPWLVSEDFSQQDVDEAKLRVFGEVDRPVAPGNKGMYLFLNSLSDEMRQKHRERLFSVRKNDICETVSRYLSKEAVCGTSLIGPENDVTSQNKEWVILRE